MLILKFREKFKVVGHACQRPTTAHGRVSRTACAHVPGDTMVARSPTATSHDVVTIKATVPRAPRPYPSAVRAGEALHGSTPMSCTSPFPITIIVPPPCVPISSCHRTAPQWRTSLPTGAAPSHLKPPGLSLVHHGAIPEPPYP
jgi:hypothetical protein